MPYSKEYLKKLNNLLQEVVKNNKKCQQCIYCHENGVCFFAYECIKNNFEYYNKSTN